MNIDHFVGRNAEVNRIIKDAQMERSSLIVGDAGVGKSALIEICALILSEDYPVIELSRVAPFSSFLRELADQLHELGILKEDPAKALKQHPNNDAKAKFLTNLVKSYQGKLVITIDDVSSITATNRTWLEELVEISIVITSATPSLLDKKGTKRFWKRFEEVKLDQLSKDEASELFSILLDRYNIKTDEPDIYKRRVLSLAQGSPFELTQIIKSHAPEHIIRARDLGNLGETRVDTDTKGIAILPWIIVLSPLAMVWRYVSRVQGDLDGYVLSAFGVAFMFVAVYFLKGSLKPKSG